MRSRSLLRLQLAPYVQNAKAQESGRMVYATLRTATYNDGYAEIAASDSARTGPETLLDHQKNV
jgi:hypothetical protein